MGTNPLRLDLIVPCYNPQPDWETLLATNFNTLIDLLPDLSIRMVLVNDGSTNGVTAEAIAYLENNVAQFHYITYSKNRGKGYALRQGVEAADAGLYVFTDIDFPYQLPSMVAIVKALRSGCDVALGYREQNYYTKVPAFRKVLSKSLRWVLKNGLRLAITDTQCGLKGFNDAGRVHFLATSIDRFLFDLEFVKRVSATKLSIQSVSVQLRDDVIFSQMNIRILLSELFNFFVLLLRAR